MTGHMAIAAGSGGTIVIGTGTQVTGRYPLDTRYPCDTQYPFEFFLNCESSKSSVFMYRHAGVSVEEHDIGKLTLPLNQFEINF